MKRYDKKIPLSPTSALPQSVRSSSFGDRWLQYFFLEEVGEFPRHALILQRRAIWIGFALLLQSLAEFVLVIKVDEISQLPYIIVALVKIFPSIFTLGSFFSICQTLRPGEILLQQEKQRFPYRWRGFLLISLLLLSVVGCILGISTLVLSFQAPRFTNDGTSLGVNAAISLLQGHDPYSVSSILDVSRRFSISPDWTTPLRQGQFLHRLVYPSSSEIHTVFAQALHSGVAPEFESKINYPALSFLIFIPFAFLKHYNVLPLYLLFYIVLVAFSWKYAFPAIRPLLLLVAMANIPMWDSVLGGNLDIFCYLFITLAWLRRDHRWQSALFLGVAIASKEIGWLFVPFYLVLIWRSISFKEAILRLCIMIGPFLCNLPFLIWDAQSWLTGISALIVDPMFPLGTGIIALSNANVLPYLPSWCYWFMEGTAFICAFVWYQRWCLRYPEAAVVLVTIPLFFAWRSLTSYFACTAFTLFVLLAARRSNIPPPKILGNVSDYKSESS